MSKILKNMVFMGSLLLFILTFMTPASATMQAPSGQMLYWYSPTASPVVSSNPAQSKPVGIGPYATGGDTINIQVDLDGFSQLMDLFGAYTMSTDPGRIRILNPDLSTQTFSFSEILNAVSGGTLPSGVNPWRENVIAPTSENLFNLPASTLPPSTYTAYLMGTPADSLDSFYIWATSFFVGGWSLQEVEATLVNNLGEGGGFDAVLLAANKGYSTQQIVEAAVTNRLQTNGDILLYGSTNLETPENPPMNLIAEAAMIKAMFTLEEMRDRFQNHELQALFILFLLLDVCEDVDYEKFGFLTHKECFEAFMNGVTEIILFGDCETECEPCLENVSDSTKVCASENDAFNNIFDYEKSFPGGGFGVGLSGPTSLMLDAGEAQGTWEASVFNGTGPFDYYFYWGDGTTSLYRSSFHNYAASHTYTAPTWYDILVRVVDTANDHQANSDVLGIEVKKEGNPPDILSEYTSCGVGFAANIIHNGNENDIYYDGWSIDAEGSFSGYKFTGTPTGNCTGSLEFTVDDNLNWHDLKGSQTCYSASYCAPHAVIEARGGLPLRDSYDQPPSVSGAATCSNIVDAYWECPVTTDYKETGRIDSCDAESYLTVRCFK